MAPMINDIVTTFHQLMNADHDTMVAVGYSFYLYIMMSRYNTPARSRARR